MPQVAGAPSRLPWLPARDRRRPSGQCRACGTAHLNMNNLAHGVLLCVFLQPPTDAPAAGDSGRPHARPVQVRRRRGVLMQRGVVGPQAPPVHLSSSPHCWYQCCSRRGGPGPPGCHSDSSRAVTGPAAMAGSQSMEEDVFDCLGEAGPADTVAVIFVALLHYSRQANRTLALPRTTECWLCKQ